MSTNEVHPSRPWWKSARPARPPRTNHSALSAARAATKGIERCGRAEQALRAERRYQNAKALNRLAAALNPAHPAIFHASPLSYYWSTYQSEKLYDKAFTMVGSVLRAEATIHNGADFRVYRPKEGDPNGPRTWRVMRRGIADLHRRAEVSRKAAERDLDALASVDDTTLGELIQRVAQPTHWHR